MTNPLTKTLCWALALGLLMAGCNRSEGEGGGDTQSAPAPAAAPAQATRGTTGTGGIDPGAYAGEVAFLIDSTITLREMPLSLRVYLGLSPQTETRLGANAFVDLRSVQAEAPQLLSGVLDETCRRELAVAVEGVDATGQDLQVTGQFQAKFFTCRRRGTPDEAQGLRLLSQNVDVIAQATAVARGQCVELRLTDLELDPSGLLGGIANLFGLTELARTVILERGGAYLAENPICPELPPAMVPLAPDLTAGGPREIPEGGVGAALSGSVDTSATTLIGLLDVMQKRGLLEATR